MELGSKLILASKSAHTGVALYTFVLTYPRVILAEVNTHRMLSRNTASSRAIPSWKQRQRVLDNPFVPASMGQNQKGMQAGEELGGWRRWAAYRTWELARYPNVLASWVLDKLGAHKQVVNRIVEPWTWTQQVVTATDLKNVFKLRNHKDAEPHFQVLAGVMQRQVERCERLFNTINFDVRLHGVPVHLGPIDPRLGIGRLQCLRAGDWHLPFIDDKDASSVSVLGLPPGDTLEALKQISTARCARVSYFLPENNQRSDFTKDSDLWGRLSQSGHWSPFEHVATPLEQDVYSGNFRAWKQYRKEFEGEAGGDR